MSGDFIRNARADRYNIMYSITAHDRKQPKYADDASSAGGKVIPQNATIAALKPLGDTLNFIYCLIKHFQHNHQEILIMYHDTMIKFLNKYQL